MNENKNENRNQNKTESGYEGQKEYRAGMKAGFFLGILAVICIAGGGYLGYRYAAGSSNSILAGGTCENKIEVLEQLIDNNYLEEKNAENLTEGVYAGLIAGLGDTYSRYYTMEEYEELTKETDGSYVGIGILMQKYEDSGVEVVECYKGAPGDTAGLLVGDVIVAVDDVMLAGLELNEVSSLIKEAEQDSVVLSVKREGVEEIFELTVPIRNVEMNYVTCEMYDEEIGYMAVSEFTGVTAKQYREAFEKLKEQGMQKLIVDLRGNPGGLYTSVCEILDEILPEGLIVYTEDKYGNREETLSDEEAPLAVEMAVLVNGNSASASEIFAGAIQDYGVGVIVGTTTYGKGVVQSIYQLEDGSAVKLTVSKYYTPNGNCIHEVGIIPDVEVELDTDIGLEEADTSEKLSDTDDTEINKTDWDNQVKAAAEVLRDENKLMNKT